MLVLRSGDIRDHCRYSKNSPDKPPIRGTTEEARFTTPKLLRRPRRSQAVDHILHDGHEKTEYTSPEEQSAHFCQALAEHLRGDALTWFSNLCADSIDSFDDLAAAFLKQHLRFALDDLVFCKTDDDTIYGLGKFGFRLGRTIPHRESRQTRIYQLEDNLGTTSDRLWSSSDLRKFHD
ncbi:unnamed protein product [Microthlaspi erraticum]|uniref:Retrotransposon gag domain-containing protein n=1 Tax=Microthlaspi erraticum TaxID=1685480 RepID=A0A6D2IRZ8_9BRAS|nr:unnamed protein product [Microthlaspi erraticum]